MLLQNIFPHKRNTNVTVGDKIFRIGDGGFIADGEGAPLDVPEDYAAKLVQGRAWRELDWDPGDPANAKRFSTHTTPKGVGWGRAPRSRDQMEADYGVTIQRAEGELVPGQVSPQAAEVDEAGRKALRITPDRGPVSSERLERLAKADAAQAAETIRRASEAGEGETLDQKEVDTLVMATQASMGRGEAEIGDGRKPGHLPGEAATPASPASTVPAASPAPAVPAVSPAPAAETFKGKGGEVFTIPADGDWPNPTPAMPVKYLREMASAYEVKHNTRTKVPALIKRINEAMYPEME